MQRFDGRRDAVLVVCDRGYLRHQKTWRKELADGAPCPVLQVEGDVIMPVDEASDRLGFAARTLRPKIERRLEDYLVNR